MKPKKQSELAEVYSGSPWQVEMVRSLLENAGIQAFLKDEFAGTISPWLTAPGGAGSVKVIVSALNYDEAKEIVAEFEKTQQ